MATKPPLKTSPKESARAPYAASMATTDDVARIGSCLLSCASFYVPVPYPPSNVAAAAVDNSCFNDASWSQSPAFSDSGFHGEETLTANTEFQPRSLYAALSSSAAVPASLGQSPLEVVHQLNTVPPEGVPRASRRTSSLMLKPPFSLAGSGGQHLAVPEALEPRRKQRKTDVMSASSSSSSQRRQSELALPLVQQQQQCPQQQFLALPGASPSSRPLPSTSPPQGSEQPQSTASVPSQWKSDFSEIELRNQQSCGASDEAVCSVGAELPLFSSMYDYTAAAVLAPPDVPVLSSLEEYGVEEVQAPSAAALFPQVTTAAEATVNAEASPRGLVVLEAVAATADTASLSRARPRSARRSSASSSSSSSSSSCSILKIHQRPRRGRCGRCHDSDTAGDSDSAPWPSASSPDFLLWVSERVAKMRRCGNGAGRRRLGPAERIERAFRRGNILSDSEDSQGSFHSGGGDDEDAESLRSDAAVVSAPMDPRRTVAALQRRLGETGTMIGGPRSRRSTAEVNICTQATMECEQIRQQQRQRREAANMAVLRTAAEYIQQRRGPGKVLLKRSSSDRELDTDSSRTSIACVADVSRGVSTSLNKDMSSVVSCCPSNRGKGAAVSRDGAVIAGQSQYHRDTSKWPQQRNVTSMSSSELIELVVFSKDSQRAAPGPGGFVARPWSRKRSRVSDAPESCSSAEMEVAGAKARVSDSCTTSHRPGLGLSEGAEAIQTLRTVKPVKLVSLSEIRMPELLPRGYEDADPLDTSATKHVNTRSRGRITHDQSIVIRRHQKRVTQSLIDLQIRRDRGEVTLRQFEVSKAQVFNCLFRRRANGAGGVEVCSMWRLPKGFKEVSKGVRTTASRRRQVRLQRLCPRHLPGARRASPERSEPSTEDRGAASIITAATVLPPPYSPPTDTDDDSDLEDDDTVSETVTSAVSLADRARLARRIAGSIARGGTGDASSTMESRATVTAATATEGDGAANVRAENSDVSGPGAAIEGTLDCRGRNQNETQQRVQPLFEPPSDTDFFMFSQPLGCLRADKAMLERRQLNIERRQQLMRALDQRAPPEFRMFPQNIPKTPSTEQLQFWEAWRAGSQDLQYTAGYLGQLENRTIIFPADIQKLME